MAPVTGSKERPEGPDTRKYRNVLVGRSASVPTAVMASTCPPRTLVLPVKASVGARLTSVTTTLKALVTLATPSLTATRNRLVEGPCVSDGSQLRTPLVTPEPLGPLTHLYVSVCAGMSASAPRNVRLYWTISGMVTSPRLVKYGGVLPVRPR